MESRKDRFTRLASRRTNDIIERIRILGNCSNKSTYEYTEEEVNKIFRAIDREIKASKGKFSSSKKKFTL